MRWDAVILAGGRGSRLGGIDKTALVASGATLLEHALAAAAPARERVVVGPEPVPSAVGQPREMLARRARSVHFVVEEPRWAGPAAALERGLRALGEDAAPFVTVLAADLPQVVRAVPLVLAAADEQAPTDAWLAVDADGRRQPLLALYRAAPLARSLAALRVDDRLVGASLRSVLTPLRVAVVPLPDALCADVDTPEDARRANIRLPSPPRTAPPAPKAQVPA